MAMSQAMLFVARMEPDRLSFVEHTMIFWHCPVYNRHGMRPRPHPQLPLLHRFNEVSSWWGRGYAREVGRSYEGPLFCGPGDMRDGETGVCKSAGTFDKSTPGVAAFGGDLKLARRIALERELLSGAMA
jgi:hypothetical protein